MTTDSPVGTSDSAAVAEWLGKPFSPDKRLVIMVAETLARHAPRRRFSRSRPSPMGYLPIAREVVATLFLLPEGQALVREFMGGPDTGRSEDAG